MEKGKPNNIKQFIPVDEAILGEAKGILRIVRKSDSKGGHDKDSFPKDPLQRCHLRWENIWFGVLRMLPAKEHYRLREAFKIVGLGDSFAFYGATFEPNPSDDTLRKTKEFRFKKSPNLRGKKPKRIYELYFLLEDYYKVLRILKSLRLPPESKPISRLKAMKERCLPEIFSKVPIETEKADSLPAWVLDKFNTEIDEKFLRSLRRYKDEELVLFPYKELAVRITAHIYRMDRETTRKALRQAKRDLPSNLLKSMTNP